MPLRDDSCASHAAPTLSSTSMNDPAYMLKVVLKAVALPPIGLLLVAFTALLLVRRRELGRWIAILCIACVVALSTPLASSALVRWLDASPAFDPQAPSSAQAIVVLGGGTRKDAAEYGGETLGRLSLERVRYAARLARMTRLPILLSGGSASGATVEASLMRDTMIDEYGIVPRWIEATSRNTYENARDSASILKANGVNRVLVVVHSFDVPRARREFARWGIDAIPAPTGVRSSRIDLPGDVLPGIHGMQTTYYACYELLALALADVRAAACRAAAC